MHKKLSIHKQVKRIILVVVEYTFKQISACFKENQKIDKDEGKEGGWV